MSKEKILNLIDKEEIKKETWKNKNQADKYEVVPLERIRINSIQLYDKETNNSKN